MHISYIEKRLRTTCLISLCSVLLLVLVGASVRSLEAGMGCPDWPKCYDRWLPPFSENQLPEDYKQHYHRIYTEKIKSMSHMLESIGLKQIAARFTSTHLYTEGTFHPLKAWVEYVNRILGVLVGLIVLTTWILSFCTLRSRPRIFWLCTTALFFTGVAGGLGALVVFTHLFPLSVSLHMSTTFVVIGCLLAAYVQSAPGVPKTFGTPGALRTLLHMNYLLLILLFLQIGLGIQVREKVDLQILRSLPREGLLDRIGVWFYVHRTTSILLLCAQFGLCYWARYIRLASVYQRVSWLILCTYIFQVLLGIILYYFHLPRFSQPLHLLFAFLSYTLYLYLILYILHTYSSTQVTPVKARNP